MVMFHRNGVLTADRHGWKSAAFVAVYFPGSSAPRSWVGGLAGSRATWAPSCLAPACSSQHRLLLTREPQELTKRLNTAHIIPFSFTSNPHWLTAAKLSTPVSFTQQQSGSPGTTLCFSGETLWYFNRLFWGRGTAFEPSLELSLVWDEKRWIKIWFPGQLCQNQVNGSHESLTISGEPQGCCPAGYQSESIHSCQHEGKPKSFISDRVLPTRKGELATRCKSIPIFRVSPVPTFQLEEETDLSQNHFGWKTPLSPWSPTVHPTLPAHH